jgi:hypothetical protein
MRLQRRIRDVRLQLLEPQLLAQGHYAKSTVHEGCARGGQCPTEREQRLVVIGRNVLLEWVALDVLDQGEVVGRERLNPTGSHAPIFPICLRGSRAGLSHRAWS